MILATEDKEVILATEDKWNSMPDLSSHKQRQTGKDALKNLGSYLIRFALQKWLLRANMSMYRKKNDISRYLPRASYLFD